MKEDFNILRQRAIQIKDEVEDGANTSTRVGSFCEDVVDTMSSTITEYNVSIQHPTSGIGGTNKYTIESAIAQISHELRHVGLKCSFLNAKNKLETWEYQGDTFTDIGNWIQCGILEILELINNIIAGNFIQYLSQDEYDALLADGKTNDRKIYVVVAGSTLVHAYIGRYQFYPCPGGGTIPKWILEDGTWKMDGVWLNDAVWNN